MSNYVLPVPIGVGWNVKKKPNWSTIIQRGVSGREVRIPLYANPIWDFEFTFNYLKDSTVQGSAPSLPTLSSTAGGSYPQTTYYVVTTWILPTGETPASPENNATISASNLLTVAQSGPVPAGALGWNVYVGLWSLGEILQTSSPLSIGATWTMPTTGLSVNPGNTSRLFSVVPPNAYLNSPYRNLTSFYNARQGAFDSFLYGDPDPASNYQSGPYTFASGDGVTTSFQLSAFYGGVYGSWVQLVQNPFHVAVYVNGTQQTSGYSLGQFGTTNGGMVTFGSAPAPNATIAWSGSYFYRLRFVEDNLEFSSFMYNLWELKSMKCMSVKL